MGAWSSQYPVQVLGADQRDCGQPRRPRLVRGLGGIGKGSMIAAALTSPCLIRSDGRTITIEPLRVVPFSHDVGVAGIPLRHANLSGTDQRSGTRDAPVSLPRPRAGGDQVGRAACGARVVRKVKYRVGAG